MENCYVNGVSAISAQDTFETEFLSEFHLNDSENVIFSIQPSYKEFIAPAAIRRMAKGVKMGIAASNKALKEANVEIPDAIITGTGMGCIEDSEKFLKAILDNKEEFLTPTSFIQSTHNTVGGQIALGLQCKGYNFTYVNGSVSFESTLLDAKLQLEEDEVNSILVGGVDETSPHTIELLKLNKTIKNINDAPFSVLKPTSKGIVFGEGASFFLLENKKTSTSYAKIKAVTIHNVLEVNEVEFFILDFLNRNDVTFNEIDTVVLGLNGDIEFDVFYNAPKSIFENIPQVYYKHLSGEYNTASSFGFWTACHIMKNQNIPEILKVNTISGQNFNKILLYNQFKGKDHSLILIENVTS